MSFNSGTNLYLSGLMMTLTAILMTLGFVLFTGATWVYGNKQD